MLQKPSSHPLGAAARKGQQALLEAVAAGKGDLTVTSTITVPTGGLETAGGTYLAPTLNARSFDYGNQQVRSIPGFSGTYADGPISTDPTTAYEPNGTLDGTSTSGKKTTVMKFLDGWTLADDYEWEETWDFSVGTVSIGAGASYGVGLRIPIKVTSTLDPTKISHVGGTDVAADVTTTVSANVIDADADFYADAGLSDEDVQKGQEFVLNADAHVSLDVYLFGEKLVDLTLPKTHAIDEGMDFRPSYANCGTKCGVDFWVPAKTTQTQIDVGIAGADAQVGFNVGGDGQVDLDYQSLFDDDPIASTKGSSSKNAHTLSFTDNTDQTLTTTLPALSKEGDKSFGYEISDVEYTWKVALTPGVKGDVWVDIPFFNWKMDIKPIWLNFAKVNVGSVHFGPHAGTDTTQSVDAGTKSFSTAPRYTGGTVIVSSSTQSLAP